MGHSRNYHISTAITFVLDVLANRKKIVTEDL